MSINRHAGLTFSGNEIVLAVPYRLNKSIESPAEKCEIFLHIPKCGGTTLHFIMVCGAGFTRKQYTRYIISDINPPVFIRAGWTGAWNEVLRSEVRIADVPAYISGHFPFGIHANINRACHYITLLRDPVNREISSFNHHYQKGYLTGGSSLLHQMLERRTILDNPQVRMLAGVGSMVGECTEDTYQKAVSNLSSHFSLVGTVEQSNEFIRGLLALNGWPAVAYVRTQVSAIKAIKSISSKLKDILYQYHLYDKRLHELAKIKWADWKNLYVQGERQLDPSEPVIYLPPDIHEKKRPVLARADQLMINES